MASTDIQGIRGIRVWDGEADLGVCDVQLEAGRILRVERGRPQRHAGLSLVPGIVDTHVHLVQYAGRRRVDARDWGLVTDPMEQMLHAAALAQRVMRLEVTTLRDLGASSPPVAIRRVFDDRVLPGPHLCAYGHVTMTAGHGDLMGPPAVLRRPLTADGADACRRLVRTYARMGVDGIKVFTSGGVMSVGDRSEWRNHTDEGLTAIVDEAHALGLRVAAHAHTAVAVHRALVAGVDSLEHATLIAETDAHLAALRGVTMAPTLLVWERTISGEMEIPEANRTKAKALDAHRGEALKRAVRIGVRFVLGTDAGSPDLPMGAQFPELRAMRDLLGLSDADVLRSATVWAAHAVGLGTRVGRVQAGYDADLIVVRGQPWEDVSTLAPEHQVAVLCRGVLATGAWPDAAPALDQES